jgi:hypothetical protein
MNTGKEVEILKSVLGKLLEREFGRERYDIYTEKLRKRESMDIFCDIYGNLSVLTEDKLNQALGRLLECIQKSIRISRNYIYISMGYLITVVVLIFMQAAWFFVCPAVTAASVCYLYKFMEFLRNRYCDRDVKIVLIYKIALFHLLEENGMSEKQ